jgi:hypothetical protein
MNTNDLQVLWEQLNGALYDLTEGSPSDAIPAIEDCIARIESVIHPTQEA